VYPADWITACTEQSIANLGFEPDVQQLHVWSDSWAHDDEWYDALLRLKERGSIRAFGVSVNDHEPASALEVTGSGRIDSLQVIYNVFDQSPQVELFDAARANDVAVIARVPLDEGSLSGRYTRDTKFTSGDMRSRYFAGDRLGQTVARVEKLRPILEGEGQSLAQGALRFCLSHDAVSTVIAGSTNPAHIRANAAVSEMGPLRGDVLELLKQHQWARNFYP
jgi:aryl-alcohol dehydrogenase-like predicted oxidoreductase